MLVTSGLGGVFPQGYPGGARGRGASRCRAAAGAGARHAARADRQRPRSDVDLVRRPSHPPPASSGRAAPARRCRTGRAGGIQPPATMRKRARRGTDGVQPRTERATSRAGRMLLSSVGRADPLARCRCPLPLSSALRPPFLVLVVLYWSIATPHAGGLALGFFAASRSMSSRARCSASTRWRSRWSPTSPCASTRTSAPSPSSSSRSSCSPRCSLYEFVLFSIDGWSGHPVTSALALAAHRHRARIIWPLHRGSARPHPRSALTPMVRGVRIKDHWQRAAALRSARARRRLSSSSRSRWC